MKHVLYLISILFSFSVSAQDGILDLTFGIDGYMFTEETHECFDAVLQPDGKIILAGTSLYHNLAVLRYTENGELDTTFNHTGTLIIDSTERIDVYAVALQDDGKIVLAGSVDFIYTDQPFLCRLNGNGSIDSTFGSYGYSLFHFMGDDSYNEYISDIAIQPDGKIVFCGSTDPWDGFASPAFATGRVLSNGMIDSTFGTNGVAITSFAGNTNDAYALVIQPDGKIITGGVSDNYFGIARHHSTGVIDSTFGNNGKTLTEIEEYAVIKQLALQTDGKIVAMGYYGNYNADIAVVRYDINGNLDHSFGTEGIFKDDIINGDMEKYGLLILPDHSILIASHRKVGGEDASLFYLTRLTSQGFTDTSFAEEGVLTIAPTDEHNYPRALLYQGDGKVIIAGYSATYDPYNLNFCALRILVELDSVTTGMQPGTDTDDFMIYTHENNLIVRNDSHLPCRLSLYDLSEKLVFTEFIDVATTSYRLDELPPSVYLAVIDSGQKQFLQKIVAGRRD